MITSALKTLTQRTSLTRKSPTYFIDLQFHLPFIHLEAMRFGSHGGMRPAVEGGRIKVTDHIIWINVIPPDGVPRRIACNSGESLLEAIKRHRVPGIHPDCDGGDKENSM